MKVKGLLKLLAAVLCLIVFSGCGKPEKTIENTGNERKVNTPVKIGVDIALYNDTFMIYLKDYMEKYAATYGDKLSITFADGKGDVATQLGQVENFIMQGVDAIIIIPVNTQAMKPVTEACLKAGVKLVYVNRRPEDLPDGIVYVGSDEKKAGMLQMEYLAKKMGSKGNVAIMMGSLETEAAFSRTEGVKEIAKEYPGIKIVKEQTASWMRDKGMTLMENWISSGDKIDAVACNNDDMALGAIEALKAAGKLKSIYVCGVDATPDALVELEKGNLSVTVFQNGKAQAENAVKAAYDLVIGEKVPNVVWVPFELVTPENYKKYKAMVYKGFSK